MNSSTLAPLLEYLGLPQPLIVGTPAAIVLVLLIWTCKRSNSTQPLIMLVRKIFFPQRDVVDPDIRRSLDAESDLAEICFRSGLRLRTLNQAKAVIRWGEQNDESLATIKGCGVFFDTENNRVNLAKTNHGGIKALQLFLILFSMLLLATALIAGMTDGAIAQLKESEKWIRISPEAVHFFNSKKIVDVATCAGGLANYTGPTIREQEFAAICNSLSTKELSAVTSKLVSQQHIAAIFCGLISIWTFYSWIIFDRNIRKAREMARRLANKSAPNPGLDENQPPDKTEMHLGLWSVSRTRANQSK